LSRMFPDVVTVEPTHIAHWISKIIEVGISQNKQKGFHNVMQHDSETLNTFIRASESLRVKNDLPFFRRTIYGLRDQVIYMQLLLAQINNLSSGQPYFLHCRQASKPRKSPISSPRFEGRKKKKRVRKMQKHRRHRGHVLFSMLSNW
jgi:hypothetical protein